MEYKEDYEINSLFIIQANWRIKILLILDIINSPVRVSFSGELTMDSNFRKVSIYILFIMIYLYKIEIKLFLQAFLKLSSVLCNRNGRFYYVEDCCVSDKLGRWRGGALRLNSLCWF